MGSQASGRTKSLFAKHTVQDCYGLSIQRLCRAGFLKQGNPVRSIVSSSGTEALAWSADQSGVTLWLESDTEQGRAQLDLDVVWTPCHFGGERPWFLCPEARCNARVGILYWRGSRFACRGCHELVYPSQRESTEQLAVRRANKIRKLLGQPPGIFNFNLFDRPKGMHDATYNRLLDQYRLEERRACNLMAQRLGVVDADGVLVSA